MRRLRISRHSEPSPPPLSSQAVLDPIGYVTNSVREPRPDGWERVESRITLVAPATAEMLSGLDAYSHIIVVFWLDRLGAERPRPSVLRPGGAATPLQGVLATRSQLRPSPLGVSVVPLLALDDGGVVVRGLDAIDRTPVLDLKPYIPYYDSVPAARVPAWVHGDDQ